MGGFELGQDDAGAAGKLLVAWRRAVRVSPLGASAVDRARLFFASKYPGARVLGVEPDPGAFELLRRNAGRLGGVTVRHAAVGDREGVATFWSAPGAVASSLHQTHDAQVPVEVEIHTLSRLL